MLQVIDNQWKDHLLSMDELKQGIGNRAYGQKDPLVEYKKESYEIFTAMMDRIEDETIRFLYFMRIESGNPPLPYPEEEEEDDDVDESAAEAAEPEISQAQLDAQQSVIDLTRNIHRKKDKELADLQFNGNGTAGETPQPVSKAPKVGRNDLCPCGSGKKYKKCHGT